MDWLPTVYDSIRLNDYEDVRVYLVDNYSEDGSVEFTLAKYPEVTVLRLPQNLGYCMAYNLSMPYAFADGCDWVVWANSDVRLEPSCLSELALATQGDQRIGILGPAFLVWEGNEPNYYMTGNYPHAISAMESRSRGPIDVEWVEGSFLMVRRECVETVGPLDPYLFMYWEEADFCRRARFEGWRVALIPSAIARHYAGGSSSNDSETYTLTNWLRVRNYYIYKLTNPFRGFTSNLLECLHLFLVASKQCLTKCGTTLPFNTKVFAYVLKDFCRIYGKWVRDRAGNHPPELQEGMLPVEPEIIHGESDGHLTLRHDRANGL
jgi:GT2 family glycosyltransferase